MYTRQQIEGVRATLRRQLQAERYKTGRESTRVQWGNIKEEERAKELTPEQALDLVCLELNQNPNWHFVGYPLWTNNGRDFWGASYTDKVGYLRRYNLS